MNSRTVLKKIIDSFSLENLRRFFRVANESFKPSDHDYSHYVDPGKCSLGKIVELGTIEFEDAQRLIVIAAESLRELTSRSGKKEQYEAGKKILKNEFYDAGIFIFYDSSGHFRFSLIVAHYFGKKREFTSFRRYTYYVSPDLTNKTFLNQIGKGNFASVDKILASFSLEAVSNEFYNEFKPEYDSIALAVRGTKDILLKQDFALLFVIRIIFLGFVQKKGWLGGKVQFIQEYWREYQSRSKGQDTFYSRWLKPLFFEALNSPPGRKVKYQNNEFSPETESILQQAPYLNGELFKEKSGVDTLDIWIPDEEIGKFFEFLFQYNFTIEENTLYDEELELNPEFLGLIFERLTNKEDGAVYTPRVEVDFMCRMALVKWLEKNSSCEKSELYKLLFRERGTGCEYDEAQKQGDFSTEEIRKLIQLLESVTVCDPAAGSGAFEVGMLHVLHEVLENLASRNNTPKDCPSKTPYERKNEIIACSLYGVEVKPSAVWINQLRLWLTLFIDMPEDFRTSHLPLLPSLNFKVRCGDALVQRIGSKMFPVQGHAMLSQAIKKKITELKKLKVDFFQNRLQDHRLIHQKEMQVFLEILDAEIAGKLKELKGFNQPIVLQTQLDGTPGERQATQLTLQLNEESRARLKKEIAELEEQKASLKDDHILIWNIEFAEIFFERQGFDIIIGNPPYVRQEDIADPKKILSPRDYKAALHEMVRLDFPKHFNHKTRIDGKSDLYTYFYVRSLHLLNPGGVHVFICSNSWLDVGYGAWLQDFLLKNVPLYFILDNHARRSFATSDVNTVITVFGAPIRQPKMESTVKFVAFKKPFEEVILTENLLEIEQAQTILATDRFRLYPISPNQLYDEGIEGEHSGNVKAGKYIGDKWGGKYLRAPDIFFTILEKGKGKLVRLKEVADVRFGIKTGANDFFYLTPIGSGSMPGLLRVRNGAGWEGEIETEFLKPVIKSPRECRSILIKPEELQYRIFMCNRSRKDLTGTHALKYIEWGEKTSATIKQGHSIGKKTKGYHEIESVKARNFWWSLGDHALPQAIWQKSVNDRHIQCILEFETYVDQRLYEVLSDSNKYGLGIVLNSVVFLLFKELYGRANLGEGALDTAVYEAKETIILHPIYVDLSSISCKIISWKAQSIFMECGLDPKSKVPISEQEPKPLPDRAELDKIVFDALELTEEERKEVYRAVCQLVWNRLSKAKSV